MLVENGHDHNHLLTKVTEKGYRKNKYNDESKTVTSYWTKSKNTDNK